jgi:P27 family predicted phage terminase small subunit
MGRRSKSPQEKLMTGAGRRPIRAVSVPALTTSTGQLVPPPWLTDKDALGVWSRVTPELARMNIITAADADTFARYCIHFAGWINACARLVKAGGETVYVKMTNSEERMPRLHPDVKVREIHERNLVDIEDRFGGSPLARYRLIAQQAAHPGAFGDLFKPREADQVPNTTAAPPPSSSPIGALRPSSLN